MTFPLAVVRHEQDLPVGRVSQLGECIDQCVRDQAQLLSHSYGPTNPYQRPIAARIQQTLLSGSPFYLPLLHEKQVLWRNEAICARSTFLHTLVYLTDGNELLICPQPVTLLSSNLVTHPLRKKLVRRPSSVSNISSSSSRPAFDGPHVINQYRGTLPSAGNMNAPSFRQMTYQSKTVRLSILARFMVRRSGSPLT